VVSITAERIVRAPHGLPDLPFFFGPSWREFFEREFGAQSAPKQRQRGLGSGVVVSSHGHLLTNHHVVDGADSIEVHTRDGSVHRAEIVGSDPQSDIAVLKIDAADLPPLDFGNSENVTVGDIVLAIGNPFGVGQTVTMGIVSATGRGGLGIEGYEDFIQTDAAINPGNSGGALVDVDGMLVGINTAIVTGGTGGGSQGVGFAIPINMAHQVAKQILEHGKVSRGYIGVGTQDLTPPLAESFGVPRMKGALIGSVEPGGPADRAGLRRGDIVRELEGKPIENARDLKLRIGAASPGQRVSVVVWRDNRAETFELELGERPTGETAQGSGSREEPGALQGVSVDELTPALSERYGLSRETRGVIVTRLDPVSRAAAAGLRQGDVIQEVQRSPVKNVAEYRRAVQAAAEGPVLLLINRAGNTMFLVVASK